MSILNWQDNSFLNFASFFIVITHNSPVSFKIIYFLLCIRPLYLFSWNFIYFLLSTNGASERTSLVNFHLSSGKSAILHFGRFLLQKSYKVSAKKVQKTYLSWHWRVMQSLKKNWLVVSYMTWEIWWNFTERLKSPKISLWWTIFVQSICGLS